MKIEKISDSEIKITISLSDLEERNIDLTSLNYNSPAAQELFWDMMEQAEVQFGFNTTDSQLYIEALPDSDEGFVVTITKGDQDGDFESIQKYIKNRFRKNELKVKRKNRRVYSTLLVYSFDSFDDLCSLSKKVSSMYSGESSLYKYKNAYYLMLTRSNFTVTNTKMFEVIISEYGNKVSNASFYEGFLNEYGTKLIEYNAVEILSNYF
ncbi:adapter protein MecA 1/2 [Anaerobacterium chartisolvens]|uniref:Adapter protein MecA 1/2 n=1 Tax=Anaerobacterium chartisolvens TaxID=1297424 RepID=A0A369BHS3_9FIRM|nr:adaptor protein MecA [Anaerobacterium chartisolvens]RCX20815.1 adapter protein MecA 1/2 [Anaerobacterium chartisolvens]